MIIKETLGNIYVEDLKSLIVDHVELEWHETNKRIFNKKTNKGDEIIFRFLNNHKQLTEGDIIYIDEHRLIIINILPCKTIIIQPKNMIEMAGVCYEIGNKHLPLFIDGDKLQMPYDEPVFKLLKGSGYSIDTGIRKLTHPLKTSVMPHKGHLEGKSLFSRILKMTTTDE